MRRRGGVALLSIAILAPVLVAACLAQSADAPQAASPDQAASARAELRSGTDLTRSGSLAGAVPHLLAARRGGADEFSSSFNLAICYLGLGDFDQAVSTLEALRAGGHATAAVENLLAQAYLGEGSGTRALEAFRRAAALTPKDEKLYAFVADACTDHRDYALGLQVVTEGLRQLPDSARLHYERALLLARLDRLGEGKPEFERAAALAPGGYIATLALVQKALYEDDYPEAIRLLREGIRAGNNDYRTLSLLGAVLLRQGAAPGTAEFAEARAALEESAKQRPGYSATEIALGKLALMDGRPSEAVERLETGRRAEPDNPEVYAGLAQAYLKLGQREKARQCQQELLRLNSQRKPGSPADTH